MRVPHLFDIVPGIVLKLIICSNSGGSRGWQSGVLLASKPALAVPFFMVLFRSSCSYHVDTSMEG